jgi:hypothetical protein
LLPNSIPPRFLASRLRASNILSLTLLLSAAVAAAQAIPNAQSAAGVVTDNGTGPAGIIPAVTGLNASLITASQHDSGTGWSTILTPGIAWRFSPALSFNASVPLYASVNVLENTGTKAHPVYVQQTKHGLPGDTALSATYELHPELLSYSATFTLGLPSGNTAYGLGSGHLGYNFNNHFEKDFGPLTPNFEAGVANSSNLIPTRVKKSYTTAGTLAHFQAGASIDLPHDLSFEADLYEDLPVSTSAIYSNTSKKKVTTASASSAAEDNGLSTSLDIPLNPHLTFSTFYDHSIRSQYDVAGFSLTFLLKAAREDLLTR